MAVPKKFKYKKIKKNSLKLKKNLFMSIKIFRENDFIVEYIQKYYLD